MRWPGHSAFALLLMAAALPLSAAGGEPSDEGPRLQIKVLTWNVQYGRESGTDLNKWPERAPLLLRTLKSIHPDVLCAQEALRGQIDKIGQGLPGHGLVAAGRDDGKRAGEHCPIFYNRAAFRLVSSGTFWLSDTPAVPSSTWGNPYPRVCTWAELLHSATGLSFRILNTHLPLSSEHRQRAGALIALQLKSWRPMDSLVVGDFNEPRGLAQLRDLTKAGLSDAYELARERIGRATYRLGSIPIARIDWILATSAWRVDSLHVIESNKNRIHASDHNGVLATLSLDAGSNARASDSVLRVLTYNVRKGSPTEDIARDIRAHAPDVALLQEIDQGTRRATAEDQPAKLAELLAMHVSYAVSYDVDGGTTGQAILSRFPLEDTSVITLQGSRNIAARGVIRWNGQRVLLVSTHFSSTYKFDLDHMRSSAAARLKEARRIAGDIAKERGPTIVAGDLNCGAGSEPVKILEGVLKRVRLSDPTFPAQYPILQLDHVMYGQGLEVLKSYVGARGTSDHRPVIVELRSTVDATAESDPRTIGPP